MKVTSQGRFTDGCLPSDDLEHVERLKRRQRQVRVAGEIPAEIVDAIEESEYLKPAS